MADEHQKHHSQNQHSDNCEEFEDASDNVTKTNKEIIDEIVDQQGSLNLNADDSEDDKFDDCIEAQPLAADPDPEASQKDYESTLTEDELNANLLQANEFKKTGNDHYKNGDFSASIDSYSSGISICPLRCSSERAILYGNRSAAHLQLSNNTLAIEDCSKAIDLNPKYTKVLLRRAKLYEENDKLDESLEDFQAVLEMDGNCTEARQAIVRLPVKINERNEKLKTEMLGKLKDLGNMILKPFGLSTNNFQMQQDPNTGSYSVNFNQNPKP